MINLTWKTEKTSDPLYVGQCWTLYAGDKKLAAIHRYPRGGYVSRTYDGVRSNVRNFKSAVTARKHLEREIAEATGGQTS